jgi:mRNA-degrading endonuclease HigB of HigAB toxin-antitoxin module
MAVGGFAIRSPSILKEGRVVLNIAGNKYRIVVWINYPYIAQRIAS